MTVVSAVALGGLPEVRKGDDIARLIVESGADFGDSDSLVIAHKIVSKAEGRTVALASVEPGRRARELARATGKDPRQVQVILDETAVLVRAERGVLLCRTRHGFVCANAGVDASNTSAAGTLVLLPRDPDASARALRGRLQQLTGAAPAVLIADSFGRAWRNGQQEVALGCAGFTPLKDWRGRRDGSGRILSATWIAVADQVAAAADLARTKDSHEPVVIVGGLGQYISAADGPGAASLIRPPNEDLFT